MPRSIFTVIALLAVVALPAAVRASTPADTPAKPAAAKSGATPDRAPSSTDQGKKSVAKGPHEDARARASTSPSAPKDHASEERTKQHADAPLAQGNDGKTATSQHATKAAAAPQVNDADDGGPATADNGDPRPEADLNALNERIQRRMAEVARGQKPANAAPAAHAASTERGSASAGSRGREAHATSAVAPPRVRLIWRTELAWPTDVMEHTVPRVSVTWESGAGSQ